MLKDFIETLTNSYIQVETIRAGGTSTGGNTPADFPKVQTGENSDGSTLISRRLVSGVSNQNLFIGLGLLSLAGVAAYAIVND